MKLEITLEQAKILKMALYNEKEVLYHDTYENRLKHQNEIIILLNKIEEIKNQNND